MLLFLSHGWTYAVSKRLARETSMGTWGLAAALRGRLRTNCGFGFLYR